MPILGADKLIAWDMCLISPLFDRTGTNSYSRLKQIAQLLTALGLENHLINYFVSFVNPIELYIKGFSYLIMF